MMNIPSLRYCVNTSDRLPKTFDIKIVEKLIQKDDLFESLGIVMIGRDEMRMLNHLYRGQSLSTDLLSFTEEPGSGDIFLCPKNILFYAIKNKIPYELRFWHLIVHGLSHIKNLDHHSYEDAEIFFRDEKRRWKVLGERIPSLKLWNWDQKYQYIYTTQGVRAND